MLLALPLLALLLPPARADEPLPPAAAAPAAPPEAPAEPGEEIVIFGDMETAARRAEVVRDLKDLGYRAGPRRDGYTIFRPEVSWKPSVRVYDDGFVLLTRSPPRFAPPGTKERPIDYLWCLPPFTPVCVQIGGQLVSSNKLDPQKGEVAYAIEPDVRRWREAIQHAALDDRINRELPGELEAAWEEGLPIDPRGAPLATPAERRAALLALWAGRACTPEGAAVREAIALYLEYEVQGSPWPVTAAEQAAANAAQPCGDALDLPGAR